jgi:hypothetical protein
MIERVEERFAHKLDRLAGDVAYGTGEILGWLVGRDIDPHIPVWDQSKIAPDGKFTRADFVYDEERDLYICPGGKMLKTSGTAHDGTTIKYIATRSDCASCPLKPQCTSGRERRIQRDVNQQARDYAQSLMETEAYAASSGERKKIERLFGEAKQILSMVRLRLRGLTGCDVRQVAAITGHRSLAMIQKYTRGADQKQLANAAILKLERTEKIRNRKISRVRLW